MLQNVTQGLGKMLFYVKYYKRVHCYSFTGTKCVRLNIKPKAFPVSEHHIMEAKAKVKVKLAPRHEDV